MTQTQSESKAPLQRLLDWLAPAWTPDQRAQTAAAALRQIGIDTAATTPTLREPETHEMEYSMFAAIREAVAELNREAERVCAGGTLRSEINGVELQKLLDNAKHSVRLLNKIQFFDAPPSVQNRYLVDPEFRAAVGSLVRSGSAQRT